jgi:hypothetical protein
MLREDIANPVTDHRCGEIAGRAIVMLGLGRLPFAFFETGRARRNYCSPP